MSQHPNRPDIPHVPSQDQHAAKQNRHQRRQLPPYRVILHYHAGNDLMLIVWTVMELMRFCREEATHKMWEAHHNGHSMLMATHLELAELYIELFTERGLNVSLEAAE